MYWDKMLIEKGNGNENDLIISENRPLFFVKKTGLETYSLVEKTLNLKEELEKISQFYTKNNLMASGNMNRVKTTDLLKFINLDSELVIVKKNNKLLGSILSILFPIHIETDLKIKDSVEKNGKYKNIVPKNEDGKTLLFANTTFLNNHKKWRGKGLGMILIQKSLQLAYDQGILCAYFLNTVPRCSNYVQIKNWIYHVNPDRLDKLKIDYNRKYRSSLTFNIENIIIPVDLNNLKESLDIYLKMVSGKKFYMYPDINFWRNWITNHKTYMIKKENEIIGIFTINKITTYVPSKKCELEHGNVLLSIGKQPDTLKAIIYQARMNEFDLLMLQECGDFNKYLLEKNMAVYTGKSDYLNFYNCRIKLKPEEVYVPLM